MKELGCYVGDVIGTCTQSMVGHSHSISSKNCHRECYASETSGFRIKRAKHIAFSCCTVCCTTSKPTDSQRSDQSDTRSQQN